MTGCSTIGPLPSIRSVAAPDYPAAELAAGIGGVAVVSVAIDSSGKITSVRTTTSSGDSGLDNAALAGAEASSYAPGSSGCSGQHYGGSVKYAATFQSGTATAQQQI